MLDAVVIGSGPSGSAAARLLASWGHSVVLLTRTERDSRGLAESLPPSTRKLLAEIGVLDDVDRAGFYRTTGNTVWWGAREGHVERFGRTDETFGYQVFRPHLDRVLLASAERAGARVMRDANVRCVAHIDDDGAEAACVEFGGDRQLTARFVLDCSGRAGVVARNGLRRYESGYRMQALVGVWHQQDGVRWAIPDETHTVVETYGDGWAWSIPINQSTRHVGLVVDGATTHITRGPTIEATYRAEMTKTRQLNELMSGAVLDHVWACDASLYSSSSYAGPRFVLVGDAGSFIDPLSSFGVKKALASAWVAAIAVHTCLEHPDRSAVALDFYSKREREVYETMLARSRAYSREAYERHPHPFWAHRSANGEADDRRAVDHAVDTDDNGDTLFRSPEVQAAFLALKERSSVAFERTDLSRTTTAMIQRNEIVVADAIAFPGSSDSIRFLAGVDLMKLCDMACHYRQVGDLFDAYCRTHGPVTLPGLLGSLSVLVAKGVLVLR
jgi:flavin-dependent dehydrogenase